MLAFLENQKNHVSVSNIKNFKGFKNGKLVIPFDELKVFYLDAKFKVPKVDRMEVQLFEDEISYTLFLELFLDDELVCSAPYIKTCIDDRGAVVFVE